MRLLLDTNVVVAGLLWNGAPRKLLDRAVDDESIELFSSPVLIDELAHTLGYAKFTKRIMQSRTSVSNLVTHYQALVRLGRYRQRTELTDRNRHDCPSQPACSER